MMKILIGTVFIIVLFIAFRFIGWLVFTLAGMKERGNDISDSIVCGLSISIIAIPCLVLIYGIGVYVEIIFNCAIK